MPEKNEGWDDVPPADVEIVSDDYRPTGIPGTDRLPEVASPFFDNKQFSPAEQDDDNK